MMNTMLILMVFKRPSALKSWRPLKKKLITLQLAENADRKDDPIVVADGDPTVPAILTQGIPLRRQFSTQETRAKRS